MVSAAIWEAVTAPAAIFAVVMLLSVIWVEVIWPVIFAAPMAASWESESVPVTLLAAMAAI